MRCPWTVNPGPGKFDMEQHIIRPPFRHPCWYNVSAFSFLNGTKIRDTTFEVLRQAQATVDRAFPELAK